MRKFILSLVAVVAVALVASNASAGIFSWLFGRSYYAPRPVVSAPAQPGVRAYSYEPGTTVSPNYVERSAPHRNAWDYPKTDWRRYSGGR